MVNKLWCAENNDSCRSLRCLDEFLEQCKQSICWRWSWCCWSWWATIFIITIHISTELTFLITVRVIITTVITTEVTFLITVIITTEVTFLITVIITTVITTEVTFLITIRIPTVITTEVTFCYIVIDVKTTRFKNLLNSCRRMVSNFLGVFLDSI